MAGNLHPKWVIVADPDIDIRSSAEVEWAQSFRVKPSQDVFIVDRTATAPLDPYTNGGYSSSVGIDATKPFGEEFPDVSGSAGLEGAYLVPELDAPHAQIPPPPIFQPGLGGTAHLGDSPRINREEEI